MKTLIKDCLRPLYHYTKHKTKREIYGLFDKWGGESRYKEIKNIAFLDLHLDVPDTLSFIYQCKEIFDDEIYRFNCNSKTPIIYDCGANIGLSAIYFKKLYPNAKITAFEACNNIVKYLQTNLKNNNIHDVTIINKAVWIDNNGIYFQSDGADGGHITQNANNIAKIDSIRLRDLLDSQKIVDFLKMDIEGAENAVIEDCKNSLSNVQNIFIEYHSTPQEEQKLGDILQILKMNHFRIYLENITKIKSPFIDNNTDSHFDLQVNIFGYKVY